MRRILPSLLALCLGVSASLLLACGGDNSHLIPSDQAQSINASLDQVRQLIDNHECDRAPQAAAEVQARVRALPQSVDRRLRERLRSGAQSLVNQAGPDCQAASTTTETIPTTTTPAPTQTETTTTTDTTTTDTTTTDTTTTGTTTTGTTTTPPPGDGTGGASPDGTGTVTP